MFAGFVSSWGRGGESHGLLKKVLLMRTSFFAQGFALHLAGAISEWVMCFTQGLFFVTFATEFLKYDLVPPKVRAAELEWTGVVRACVCVCVCVFETRGYLPVCV